MSAAGTYARVPMGEAFDVMCRELDDIVNRMCGIEEVALAYAWMNKHSMKVPTLSEREGAATTPSAQGKSPGGMATGAVIPQPRPTRSENADRLGDGVAVGQAAGSGSAATNGEPERAALSPSLPSPAWFPRADAIFACDPCECGGSDECDRCGLVGEPPSLTRTDSREDASLGTDASRKHGGGSPTRHLSVLLGGDDEPPQDRLAIS